MSPKRKKPKEQYVRECREWLARRKAWLDQRKKQFEDEYPSRTPQINLQRMHDLEAWEFAIEVHEHELEEYINWPEEDE